MGLWLSLGMWGGVVVGYVLSFLLGWGVAYVKLPGSYFGIIQMKICSSVCVKHSCIPPFLTFQTTGSYTGVMQITLLTCFTFDMQIGYVITSVQFNRE